MDLLKTIWASVLGHSEFTLDDPLFREAADSLSLFRFLLLVEERFGLRLAPHSPGEQQTLRELAEFVEQARSQRRSLSPCPERPQIVRLPGRGPKSPVFFVHPAGGSAHAYYQLAKLMRMDRPVFGVHAPALAAADAGLTIAAIALRYLEAVRDFLSSMPSAGAETGGSRAVLAGFSLGGAVAYEMACQLAKSGAGAPPVVMIDIASGDVRRTPLQLSSDVVANLPQWLRHDAIRAPPHQLLHRLWRQLHKAVQIGRHFTNAEFLDGTAWSARCA